MAFLTLAAGSVEAQTISVLTTPDDTYGLYITCMSDDGHWVGGMTYAATMFIADWAKDSVVHSDEAADVYGATVNGLSNSGLGVGYDGPAVTYDYLGNRTVLQADSGSYSYIAYDINNDDSLIVGCRVSNSYKQEACYWAGGELSILPMCTSSKMGFDISGSCATHISNDGSIILGYVIDNKSTYPAVLWRWTDEGYVLDTICKGRFHPQADDANSNVIDSGEPYTTFSSAGLSPNGKYALIAVAEALGIDTVYYKGDKSWPLWTAVTSSEQKIAVYDTEADTLTIYTVDGNNGIEAETGLQPYAIADDGTIVGFTSGYESRYPIIILPGESQPRTFADYFPTFDFTVWAGDCCAAAISVEGRYIAGFGLNNATAQYESWVIDREGVAAEEDEEAAIALTTARADNNVVAYYSIDGRRLTAPTKGLNIIHLTDGTTKKIIVK